MHIWKFQFKDILVQVHLLISAYTVTWVSMDLKEVYTLVVNHF